MYITIIYTNKSVAQRPLLPRYLVKTIDLITPLRKFRLNDQGPTHGFNVPSQSGNIHVRTVLNFRYRSLIDMQPFCQFYLGELSGLTNLVERERCE